MFDSRPVADSCRMVLVLILLLMLSVLLSGVAAGELYDTTVLVGVAQTDITPQTPVRMYGYAARTTESTGIAGRLRAKALVIGDDAEPGPAVLLTVDCGAVPAAMRDEVLQRVRGRVAIRPERFVLCNSHQHSGPNLKGMNSLSGREHEHLAAYARELTDKLTAVVLDALAARRPGRLAWTQGIAAVAANRRVLRDGQWAGFGAVPEGAVDHSLPLLRVTDTQGQIVAVVVNYACHNTTLRGDFQQIHGDWAAAAQEAIEADHPDALALITIGCGADSDPHPHGTVELCERHGRTIADEVKRLLQTELQSVQPALVARTATLEIPFAPVPTLDELRGRAADSWMVQRVIEKLEQGESLPDTRPYQITTWSFGEDLAMVFLSDEVVADYALRMKRELVGDRLWITAYAHDISGYIVSKRLLAEGGYEVRNSVSTLVTYGEPESLQPAMEDRIIQQVRALLAECFAPALQTSSTTNATNQHE
jgi:neutral ceramidase